MYCVFLGNCTNDNAANSKTCYVGRNGTTITLSNHISSITLVCSVKNIVYDTKFGPALPSPTYVWKKNGITSINENGFTENFTTLYFQMWKLTSIPVPLLNGNNITINLNTVGNLTLENRTLSCFNHRFKASLEDTLFYFITLFVVA